MASWLFFLRRGGSLRINADMLVARALKNSQLAGGESHVICGAGHTPTLAYARFFVVLCEESCVQIG